MFVRILISILIVSFPVSLLQGLETELSAVIARGQVVVRARAVSVETEKIMSSLEEGFRSEIVFQFRVYSRNTGFFSFLGDWLIAEKRISYTAFKDFFLGQYAIRIEDRKPVYFGDRDEFFDNFTVVTDFGLIDFAALHPGEFYVLARVSVNPVKLEPPLHIITLFSSVERTSAWKEFRFTEKEETR